MTCPSTTRAQNVCNFPSRSPEKARLIRSRKRVRAAAREIYATHEWLILDLHEHLIIRFGRRAVRRTFGRYSLSGLYDFICGQ